MSDFDTQVQIDELTTVEMGGPDDALRAEIEAEMYASLWDADQARWDDDPNPYHGDYSEE